MLLALIEDCIGLMLREFMQDGHKSSTLSARFGRQFWKKKAVLLCGHVATPVATTIESLLRGPMRIRRRMIAITSGVAA
jgi:hypothetical protein